MSDVWLQIRLLTSSRLYSPSEHWNGHFFIKKGIGMECSVLSTLVTYDHSCTQAPPAHGFLFSKAERRALLPSTLSSLVIMKWIVLLWWVNFISDRKQDLGANLVVAPTVLLVFRSFYILCFLVWYSPVSKSHHMNTYLFPPLIFLNLYFMWLGLTNWSSAINRSVEGDLCLLSALSLCYSLLIIVNPVSLPALIFYI